MRSRFAKNVLLGVQSGDKLKKSIAKDNFSQEDSRSSQYESRLVEDKPVAQAALPTLIDRKSREPLRQKIVRT